MREEDNGRRCAWGDHGGALCDKFFRQHARAIMRQPRIRWQIRSAHLARFLGYHRTIGMLLDKQHLKHAEVLCGIKCGDLWKDGMCELIILHTDHCIFE
jgi:hypothetical protein